MLIEDQDTNPLIYNTWFFIRRPEIHTGKIAFSANDYKPMGIREWNMLVWMTMGPICSFECLVTKDWHYKIKWCGIFLQEEYHLGRLGNFKSSLSWISLCLCAPPTPGPMDQDVAVSYCANIPACHHNDNGITLLNCKSASDEMFSRFSCKSCLGHCLSSQQWTSD